MPEPRDLEAGEIAVLTEALVDQLFPTVKSLAEVHQMSPCQAVTLVLHALNAIHKGLHAHEKAAQPEHDPVPMLNDPQWS